MGANTVSEKSTGQDFHRDGFSNLGKFKHYTERSYGVCERWRIQGEVAEQEVRVRYNYFNVVSKTPI